MKNYVTSLGIALTLAFSHAAQAQGIPPAPVPTNTDVSCSSWSPNSMPPGLINIQPTWPGELTGGITGYALDPLTLWAFKGGRPLTRLTIGSDRFLQAPQSNRSGARARTKKRIVAGAIAGAVGGFFAGGFLGAHIEGDRCDCDDPGVRGFLIGAPIGALAGGIAGGKFLF